MGRGKLLDGNVYYSPNFLDNSDILLQNMQSGSSSNIPDKNSNIGVLNGKFYFFPEIKPLIESTIQVSFENKQYNFLSRFYIQ
jgi:hypothetical protein